MNTHNPYTPPNAPVSDAPLSAAVVRKPVSVWLLQLICALAVLGFLYGLITSIGRLAASQADIARLSLLVSLLLRLLTASLFVTTIIAAQRRSQLGRWLGTLLLAILVATMVFGFIKTTTLAGVSLPTLVGYFIGSALVLTPLMLLIYFSAFSKRARTWYGKASTEARS